MRDGHSVSVRVDVSTALLAMCKMEEAMRNLQAAIGHRIVRSLRVPVLMVDDPFDERPASFMAWLEQAGAILRHEFWMAAGRPERSPGARWEMCPAVPSKGSSNPQGSSAARRT